MTNIGIDVLDIQTFGQTSEQRSLFWTLRELNENKKESCVVLPILLFFVTEGHSDKVSCAIDII